MQQQIVCEYCLINLGVLTHSIVFSFQQPFHDVDKVSSFLLATTVDPQRSQHTKLARRRSGSGFHGISSFLRAYSISTAN